MVIFFYGAIKCQKILRRQKFLLYSFSNNVFRFKDLLYHFFCIKKIHIVQKSRFIKSTLRFQLSSAIIFSDLKICSTTFSASKNIIWYIVRLYDISFFEENHSKEMENKRTWVNFSQKNSFSLVFFIIRLIFHYKSILWKMRERERKQ